MLPPRAQAGGLISPAGSRSCSLLQNQWTPILLANFNTSTTPPYAVTSQADGIHFTEKKTSDSGSLAVLSLRRTGDVLLRLFQWPLLPNA
jgi:hypothetical protein